MTGDFTQLAPNKELSFHPDDKIVCPNCYKPITHHNAYGPGKDRYGRNLRSYIGHCLRCDKSFEVLQFEQAGVWVISGYRFDKGRWITLQDLPEPLVATGPGGDYVQAVTADEVDHCLSTIILNCASIITEVGAVMRQAREALNQRCRKS